MTTKRYIRIEGSLQDKFSQISEDIFVVGKYMFVPEELFESFMNNDMETAMKYGSDIDFLKRNNAELK